MPKFNEPWTLEDYGGNLTVADCNERDVAFIEIPAGAGGSPEQIEIDRGHRIVACVNACRDLPTAALETIHLRSLLALLSGDRFASLSMPVKDALAALLTEG